MALAELRRKNSLWQSRTFWKKALVVSISSRRNWSFPARLGMISCTLLLAAHVNCHLVVVVLQTFRCYLGTLVIAIVVIHNPRCTRLFLLLQVQDTLVLGH